MSREPVRGFRQDRSQEQPLEVLYVPSREYKFEERRDRSLQENTGSNCGRKPIIAFGLLLHRSASGVLSLRVHNYVSKISPTSQHADHHFSPTIALSAKPDSSTSPLHAPAATREKIKPDTIIWAQAGGENHLRWSWCSSLLQFNLHIYAFSANLLQRCHSVEWSLSNGTLVFWVFILCSLFDFSANGIY
ncbi:hypothetical protein KSP40_PGU014025 [Platanthera guangdongensis]|uniref:Uncharacterized protein n=1 Tax=Platanthera guangdongensis TaxID=2320717 RepID=A0ABR2N191_9ASPA